MILRKDLIEALRIWNYWDRNFLDIKKRKDYEDRINKFRDANEVIVLKGIRRCGKSTLLNLEIKNLLKNIPVENTLFINFEEPKFYNNLNLDLLDEIYEAYLEYLEPKGKVYIFLDEVQNIQGWEKWVLRNYEKENVQMYVTGSSSKLLSKEFSTALSGRHLSLDIFPLSFNEFISFKNISITKKLDLISKKRELLKLFKEYVLWGGFPKVIELEDDLLKKSELISYYETIVLKDIAQRYKISNIEELKNLIYYFLSNNTKLFSLNKLSKLNLASYDTLKKYLMYIKEAYLLFDLSIFDYSIKKQLVNPKKIYAIDTGLVNSISFKFSEDTDRLLENLVFIELKRRGKEIYYHKDKAECDFVIKEGLYITEAIQVTDSLQDIDIKKREIKGIKDAMNKYNLKEGLILTQDEEYEIKEDNKKIKVMPVWKWLLIES